MSVRHRHILRGARFRPGGARRLLAVAGTCAVVVGAAAVAPAGAATPVRAAATSASATAAVGVDISTRAGSLAFWNSDHTAAPDPGWTGNVGSCNAGTTTPAFQAAVAKRINYYRAMAGDPAGTTIDPTTSAKAQQAALMMSANASLSHDPPSTWTCSTMTGHDAAGQSNLALYSYGLGALDNYMMDSAGGANAVAGHRRWLLYPQTQSFGTGDIPTGTPANALYIFDGRYFDPRPATREPYVAWPPPGYVPNGVIYRNWSLSDAKVDFSGATVSMTRNGAAYPVTRQTPANDANGFGENSLVWAVGDISDFGTLSPPAADTPYTVDIVGAMLNGVARSYHYTVTAFDPDASSATVPGVPGAVSASAGDGAATVSWSAPASDGGSGITGYRVSASPGGATVSTGPASRSATVPGLSNGTSYRFTVAAVNAVGTGPSSAASNAVTPTSTGTTTTLQDLAFAYDTWSPRPLAAGGTYRASGTAGSSAAFTFTGTGVSWLARGGPAGGQARVLVDGTSRRTVDLYRSSEQAVTVSFSGLGSGQHTIVVQVLGTRSAASAGTTVALDAMRVGTTVVQDSSPKLRYGRWTGGSNAAASGGTLRLSAAAGAAATVGFTGSAVDWVTARGPAYGQASVSIDGVDKGSFDLYAPTQQWRAVQSFSGLSPGGHVLRITVSGAKRAASTGTAVVVDALVVHP